MSDFIPTTLYQTRGPMPDDYDKGMVDTYLKEWNNHFRNNPDVPRVGDYIIMSDGTYERGAHVWEEGVQTCVSGSFALGNGYMSMSGSLNPSIPKEKLVRTDKVKSGNCWVFHHDLWFADNSIGVNCSCRVFKVI